MISIVNFIIEDHLFQKNNLINGISRFGLQFELEVSESGLGRATQIRHKAICVLHIFVVQNTTVWD